MAYSQDTSSSGSGYISGSSNSNDTATGCSNNVSNDSTKNTDSFIKVYNDGVFDLMHSGHFNAIRQARALGDHLTVGVIADEEVFKAKGSYPIYTEAERVEIVRNCKWVDRVVVGVPYDVTNDVIRLAGCAFCTAGDDYEVRDGRRALYDEPRRAGLLKLYKRTEGTSTTQLMKRLLHATFAGPVSCCSTDDDDFCDYCNNCSSSSCSSNGANIIKEMSRRLLYQYYKFGEYPLITSDSTNTTNSTAVATINNNSGSRANAYNINNKIECTNGEIGCSSYSSNGDGSSASSSSSNSSSRADIVLYRNGRLVNVPADDENDEFDDNDDDEDDYDERICDNIGNGIIHLSSSKSMNNAVSDSSNGSSSTSACINSGATSKDSSFCSSNFDLIGAPASAFSPFDSRCLLSTQRLFKFIGSPKNPQPDQTIVYIDGSFDVFHVGHVRILKKAKALGHYLVVGIHDDATVRRVKGAGYPIVGLLERCLSVLAMRSVDEVVIGAPWVITRYLLKMFRIDIVVRGIRIDSFCGKRNCNSINQGDDPYKIPKQLGVYREVESSSTVTTWEIIQRIKANRRTLSDRVEVKGVAECEKKELDEFSINPLLVEL